MLPNPYYEENGITIYNCDCREVLPEIGDVDLVLTDPPYEMHMGDGGCFKERLYVHDIKKAELNIGISYRFYRILITGSVFVL